MTPQLLSADIEIVFYLKAGGSWQRTPIKNNPGYSAHVCDEYLEFCRAVQQVRSKSVNVGQASLVGCAVRCLLTCKDTDLVQFAFDFLSWAFLCNGTTTLFPSNSKLSFAWSLTYIAFIQFRTRRMKWWLVLQCALCYLSFVVAEACCWAQALIMVGGRAADLVPTTAVKIFSAGTAGCVADLVTFPLDTAKVRLQVRHQEAPPTSWYLQL